MRSRLLISSMILAVGLTAATAGPAPIYVDNIRGNDTYDGSRERPFASLEKACLQVRTSGRIEVVNTGKPYQMPYDGPGRHGLRLRTGGTPDAPLVVEGNGAEISCLAVIPATAWTREEERIYSLPFDPMSNMFRRDRTKDYWLDGTPIWFVDGRPAPNLHDRKTLKKTPGGFWWNKKERKVLYHLPAGQTLAGQKIELPANYGFYIHRDYTIVRNFTVMFSWNDGFDAAENPKGSMYINCLAYNSCGQGMSLHDAAAVTYLDCGAVNCASSAVCNIGQSQGVYQRCVLIDNTFEAAVFLSDNAAALFEECIIADPEPGELIRQQRRSLGAFSNCVLLGRHGRNMVTVQAGTLSFFGCTMLYGSSFCSFAPADASGSISVRQSMLGNFSRCCVELPKFPNNMRIDLAANQYQPGTCHLSRNGKLIPGASPQLAAWKIDLDSTVAELPLSGRRNCENPDASRRRSKRIGALLPKSVWQLYDRLKNFEATPAGIVRKKDAQ